MTNSGACRTPINHWDNFPSHQLCKLNQKNYVQITLRAWHKPRKARQLGAKVEILASLCPAVHWLFRRQAVHGHHGKAVFLFLPGAPVSANHAMAASRSLRDRPAYSFGWYSKSILSRLTRARTYLRCLWGCSMACSTTALNTVMLMDRLSYEPLTACVKLECGGRNLSSQWLSSSSISQRSANMKKLLLWQYCTSHIT